MDERERRETMAGALIGDRHRLYMHNAEFRYFITSLLDNLPLLVDFAAERSIAAAEQADRIARLMREPRL